MRPLRLALAISAALHAAAIAWVQPGSQGAHAPGRVTPEPVIEVLVLPPGPAPDPTSATALPEDHSVVATARSSEATRTREPTRPPAREARATVTLPPVATMPAPREPTAPTQPPARSPLLSMRRPEVDLSVRVSPEFLERSRPLAPKAVSGEQLADELASAEARLKSPGWLANASPDQVSGERARVIALRDELAHRELQPDGTGHKAEHRTFRVKVAADGSARIEDKANLQRKGLGASFDVTDALMRRQRMDPYASYKLKVLDETREERVAIGRRHRTQQLAQSRQHVQAHLTRLWTSTDDLTARKRALFELWDDCAETGTDELIAGGRSARAHVVGFIRSRLPAGSAGAFTDDELARLNRIRTSREPFQPYDGS